MKSKSLWPLGLISFFVVFVAAAIAFVVFSMSHSMDLVAADYYEREIRYGEQMERMKRVQRLEDSIEFEYQPGQGRFLVQLPMKHRSEDLRGTIHLYRPSDANLDQELPINVRSDGVQVVDTSHLSNGLWRVKMQWTAQGESFYLERSLDIH